MSRTSFLPLLLCSIFFTGCETKNTSKQTDTETPARLSHTEEINQWVQDRLDGLKDKDGWLSLAGLYWITEGENRIGTHAKASIRFPERVAPATALGSLVLRNDSVFYINQTGTVVKHQGRRTDSLLMWPAEEIPSLEYLSLSWHVIKRGDRYGIRLKDSLNLPLSNFKGIERYPTSANWRVRAKVIPGISSIQITDITDNSSVEESPGTLSFEIDGRTFTLKALEGGETSWFLVFSDLTNNSETYPLGRFLYVDLPDDQGFTWIDFNKAYNPPCAFTPFATCPLPPRENQLDIAVTAGEKRYAEEASSELNPKRPSGH